MEVVVRVPIFYVLENIFNYILGPHPNSNTKNFCSAEKMCSNSVKINLVNLFFVSSCMIQVATPLKSMRRLIKWLTLNRLIVIIILLCSFYYFDDYFSVTLSNPSAMAFRGIIYGIVFYFIYQQFDVERRATVFWILKYIIALTFWLWTLHYFYDDCNVDLSHHFLVELGLRIATFFIASLAVILSERECAEECRAISVAICFLVFTFGPKTAEFQSQKYIRIINLMLEMFQKNRENGFGRLQCFLIGLTIFIIELATSLYNYFPWTFSDLVEWNFLREIYNTESVTVFRFIIIGQLLLDFNKSILKNVQYKFLQTSPVQGEVVEEIVSPLNFFIFAIDGQIWNSNAESRWNMLTVCCLINCGALLSNICKLVGQQEGKKQHYKTLGLSVFTFIGAVLLLGFSLWTESSGTHLFIIASLSIYVIVAMPLMVLKYYLEDVGPYNENVEAPHRVFFLVWIELGLMYCLFLSLFVALYVMATHEGFGLLLFRGAVLFLLKFHDDLKFKYSLLVNYLRIRWFIYFVCEAKPEVIKELNDVCSICRGEMMVSGCVTSCKHHYHKHCLLLWLYKSNTCPICNNELYALSTY